MSSWTLEALERELPWVSWREPLPVGVTNGMHGMACRVCIANEGLKATDVSELPQTRGEWDVHFATHLPAV